jgi:hypothetical protein
MPKPAARDGANTAPYPTCTGIVYRLKKRDSRPAASSGNVYYHNCRAVSFKFADKGLEL